MFFNTPFAITAITQSNQSVNVKWETTVGRRYQLEASSNLISWFAASATLTATSPNLNWSTNRTDSVRFYRINRLP